MGFAAYARLLRVPAIRQILTLTLLSRTPLWAGNVVVTLHVVSHLGRSYAAAGLVSAVQAVMLCLSGPFRGRRLDRLGLRRAVAPSLGADDLARFDAEHAGMLAADWPERVTVPHRVFAAVARRA